jgi:hypothetical protein
MNESREAEILSADAIGIINEHLDHDLAHMFGYELLSV